MAADVVQNNVSNHLLRNLLIDVPALCVLLETVQAFPVSVPGAVALQTLSLFHELLSLSPTALLGRSHCDNWPMR